MQWRTAKPLRILDWDLENRPLSYLGMDFTTAEITAIAWSWVGSDEVECLLLNRNGRYVAESGRTLSRRAAFGLFVAAYTTADMVTGHYIRKHDLPIVNGALLEAGLAPLPAKLTSDTKLDMVKRSGISAAQAALAGMYGLEERKKGMSQHQWREANRLTAAGLQEARERVVDDVVQHKALRAEMVRLGHLGAPKVWRPL